MEDNIHFGHLGNGVTVWDSSRTEDGDYPKVAHIDYDHTVTYYRDVSPKAMQRIENFARYDNMSVSATQTESLALKPIVKSEYQALISAIKTKFTQQIEPVDADPDRWYELFVNEGEKEGTHTVESGDTFDQAVADLHRYAESYGLDNIFLDVWTDRESPRQTDISFWSADLFYSLLRDYFGKSGQLSRMKMAGAVNYDPGIQKDVFTKETCGEGEYFADEIAFRYFRHRVCHICEHSEPADPNDESGVTGSDQSNTRADLVELCGGDEKKAAILFDRLDWRSPGTLLNEWDDDNG